MEFYLEWILGNLLLLALIFRLFKFSKFGLSNAFLIAIFSNLLLITYFGDIFIHYYSGYLSEAVAFKFNNLGYSFIFYNIFAVSILLLSLLNYKEELRKNTSLQWFIMIFLAAIILINFRIIPSSPIPLFGLETGFIVYDFKFSLDIFILPAIFLFINFLIVRFKLLPEFKEYRKDQDDDSIIDSFIE